MKDDNCISFEYGFSVVDWLTIGSVSIYSCYSLGKFLPPNLINDIKSWKVDHLDHKTIFFTILALIMALLSIYKLSIRVIKGKNYAYLTPDGVKITIQGLIQKNHQFNYDSIFRMVLKRRKGSTVLNIYTKKDVYHFSSQNFEHFFIFENFCDYLSERSNINIVDKTKFFKFSRKRT